MPRKTQLLLGGAVVVVLAVAFLVSASSPGSIFGINKKRQQENEASKNTKSVISLGDATALNKAVESIKSREKENSEGVITRQEVVDIIEIPKPGDALTVSEIAVPTVIAIRKNYNIRAFTVNGEGGKLSPSIFVVNEGDVVDLTVFAKDRDYAIQLSDFGVFREIKHGEKGSLQFGARPSGEYKIICETLCGRESLTLGTLIINPNQK